MAAVTEPHFDHIGGNCFFKEKEINIFGHKDICRPKNPDIIVPGHGDLITKSDIPKEIQRIRSILHHAIAAGHAPDYS
jgi:metal-dependent hydrolase (beta-lactamase superfamily II)